MTVRRFEDLEVWRRAKTLAVDVYRASDGQRFARDFGLRDQVRRAAVSVMSNIAEGFERHSRPDFARFLAISRGSVAELRSQLNLALELEYIDRADFDRLYAECVELSRMLGTLRASQAR